MDVLYPTIILGGLALVLFCIAYFKGDGGHIQATKASIALFLKVVPLVFFALMVSSLVRHLLPQEAIATWIGPGSGWRGLIFGTIAGFLTPGGPFVSFPIAAGFLSAGAGFGTMVSYVTAWSIGAITRIPIEAGFLGFRFTIIHLLSTFFFPPIAGWISDHIFRIIR